MASGLRFTLYALRFNLGATDGERCTLTCACCLAACLTEATTLESFLHEKEIPRLYRYGVE